MREFPVLLVPPKRNRVGGSLLAATFLLASTSASPHLLAQSAHQEEAHLIGVWQLDLSKSKFSPGPPPTRETRTYTRDDKGVAGRIERHFDDGRVDVIDYRADYDRDHLVYGSRTYDTLLLRRIDALTAEAVLSHAGRVFGTARRVMSPDGQTMTVTFRRTEPGDMIYNVAVYRKRK